MSTQHKVEYLIPGSFMPEEVTRTVDHRDPARAAADAPPSAFCFTIFDVEAAPDLGPDFKVYPKPKNRTGRYYIDATVYELADVVAELGEQSILAWNMATNGWGRVVKCRAGNWQPLDDADTIIRTGA